MAKHTVICHDETGERSGRVEFDPFDRGEVSAFLTAYDETGFDPRQVHEAVVMITRDEARALAGILLGWADG